MAYISRHEWLPPDPSTFRTGIGLVYNHEGDYKHISGVNTYIRTYAEGDGDLDHIATAIEPDVIHRKSLRVPQVRELAGVLFSHNFPHYHDIWAEPEVKEWAASVELSEDLDSPDY